jgi:hypothetical protein
MVRTLEARSELELRAASFRRLAAEYRERAKQPRNHSDAMPKNHADLAQGAVIADAIATELLANAQRIAAAREPAESNT